MNTKQEAQNVDFIKIKFKTPGGETTVIELDNRIQLSTCTNQFLGGMLIMIQRKCASSVQKSNIKK